MAEQAAKGAAKELPVLKVTLLDGDRVVRVIEIPDPREALIRHLNAQAACCGLRASAEHN